jgi:hypothetical protein
MLPRADITGIRPVTPIAPASAVVTLADARQEAVGRLAHIILGQQVQATVLSALDDGSFLVRVADATARMNLPANAKPGDALLLTLTSTSPRPTFLLEQPAISGATVNTTVSATGRLIDQLLQSARQTGAPTSLQGNAPLLPAASANPGQIMPALRDAVAFSGLFYESHLAQWVAGKRSLPELMREPQTQASKLLLPDTAQILRTEPLPRAEALSPQSAQLIPQQLDTLENQRVAWRGELWPGQALEWEISKDAPQDGAPDTLETEPSWHSVVRFELPLLGKVTGSIRLAGQRLQMQLRTETDGAALALRTHGAQLAEALGAAGANLESLTIKRDAPSK